MPAYTPFRAPARSDSTQEFWHDPAMPFVESRRACHSRACYRLHHHPTFSIGSVDGGRSVFTGSADGPVELLPGTLVFVPATRVHACNPIPETDWSYQMLHLDAAWLQTLRMEYAHARSIDAEPIRVVTNPSVYARFSQLNELLFSKAPACDKEAALIEFFGDFDTRQGLRIEAPDTPPNLAKQIHPALDLLRTAPASSITLDQLALLAGMSRYQVIRAFRAVTGMTPHAWQLNQRIILARERIRSGDRISDVAQQLGFADQAHFQRVFKAHAGVTPRRFRA